jgi:hypothetical protein
VKPRTEHQAILGAESGQWTVASLQTAQEIANHIHRPWGHRRPTAAAVWQQRERITVRQRAAFGRAVQKHREQARAELGYTKNEPLDRKAQARVDRLAISRACVERGLLTLRIAGG